MKFPLLLDGATGTALQARGMPGDVCPEKWILEHPDALIETQRAYVAAGSCAVYAPTFGANRVKLAKYGLADEVERMNRELVALSRKAVGEGVMVGGDMSPSGLFLKPFGDTEFSELVSLYREQAAVLADAGVDFFGAETMMTLTDARAALIAAKEVSDKPVFVTVTCDEDGRMLSGTSAAAALVALQAMGADAFGLNCGSGPDAMLPIMRELSRYAKIPLIIKPNAGLPVVTDGVAAYKLPPEEFTAHTREFAEYGVCIFGGCCGTTEEHIDALTRSLDGVQCAPHFCDTEYLANERDILEIPAGFGEVIRDYDPDGLADELMDAEDGEREGVALYIADGGALTAFEENQYLIKKPLCLSAATPELLSEARRVYNGCAAYVDVQAMLKHREEILQIEANRLAGAPTYTLDEVKKYIKEKYFSE